MGKKDSFTPYLQSAFSPIENGADEVTRREWAEPFFVSVFIKDDFQLYVPLNKRYSDYALRMAETERGSFVLNAGSPIPAPVEGCEC